MTMKIGIIENFQIVISIFYCNSLSMQIWIKSKIYPINNQSENFNKRS